MKNLTAAFFFYVTIVGSSASCLVCVSLLDASIKSLFLLVLATVTCLMLVQSSAATRHLVWATTLLGMLLMPLFAWLLPEWRVLPEWLSVENRIQHAVTAMDNPLAFEPFTHKEPTRTESHPPFQYPSTSVTVATPDVFAAYPQEFGSPRHDSVPTDASISIRLSAALVIFVWAIGCLMVLLPMLVAVFRLRRLERTYPTSTFLNPRIAIRIATISRDLGIRVPRVIVGPVGAMPMVWTLGRSRLLLPHDIVNWTGSKLNAVLLHELIHLRRHDPAICSLALIARALNWFNPLAWYAVKHLRRECEHACDDQVLRMGVEPSDYASHLLELSTSPRFAANAGPLAIAMASMTSVEDRIVAILSVRQNRRGVTLHRVLATLLSGSIVVAILASAATPLAASKGIPKETPAPIDAPYEDSGLATEQEPANGAEQATEKNNEEYQRDSDPAVETNLPVTKPLFGQQVLDLTLEQCISFALNNTRGIQVAPRGASRANLVGGNEDPLSEFDSQYTSFLSFNSTNRYRNLESPKSSSPQPPAGADTTTKMAISKRLASDGVNRILIILVHVDDDISIDQYEERIRNLVRDIEFAYWDLCAAYFNVETARIAVDSAGVAWKIANAKLSTSAKNEEAQARVTYHQFKAQLDAALAGGGTQGNDPGLYGREQNLRLLMGLPANDGRLIRPSDKPALNPIELDFSTIEKEMLNHNLDLRYQKWNIKQRELELMSAKNQALPDVNLSLNYRWLGVGSNLIDRRGGNAPFPTGNPSAFEELFGGNYQEGGIRMEFNPNAFGSRRQLNDVQNKQLALAREHRILEAKEIAAIHRLSALWQQVDSLHKQMTQQFQALSAATTLVEVTNDKFILGAGEPNLADNLLRAQQTKSQAGQNYIRAVTEYNKSLVELHAIKGSLLEYNNIQMEAAK